MLAIKSQPAIQVVGCVSWLVTKKTEEEAKALRTKIAADSRVPSSGAFCA